jgi:hypothetical protein
MSRYVTVDAEVFAADVIEHLDDAELKEFGLRRIAAKQSDAAEFGSGFGRETPTQESIRMACLRGDLPAFIEATRQLLDEEGIFLRTDRLMPAREMVHG